MPRDRGSDEPRDVNKTIHFRPDPPSRGGRARKKHVPAVASSDETRVGLCGSGHVWQPASYKTAPEERRKQRNVSMVTVRTGVREVVRG